MKTTRQIQRYSYTIWSKRIVIGLIVLLTICDIITTDQLFTFGIDAFVLPARHSKKYSIRHESSKIQRYVLSWQNTWNSENRDDNTNSNNNHEAVTENTSISSPSNNDPTATETNTDIQLPLSDITSPNPALDAIQVATLLMDALQNESNPQHSLEMCFQFSSDRCRMAVGGKLQEFIKYANNPTFGSLVHCQNYNILSIGPIIPGSIHRGDMQTILIEITKPLTVQKVIQIKQTQDRMDGKRRPTIAERIQARQKQEQDQQQANIDDVDDEDVLYQNDEEKDGSKKTFLWTLQKERRPPRQDCWLVHEVLYEKNAFSQTF